jgi:hypothetical protein
MYKAKTLRVESNPSLDPNGELKSIYLINMTYLSLEEALDKINPRVTNPRKILDVHEESTLELEKEDNINEHGSYFMSTSSNPCSHEKTSELIGHPNIATHKIFNPLILPIHKDMFVYHKFCRSYCMLA